MKRQSAALLVAALLVAALLPFGVLADDGSRPTGIVVSGRATLDLAPDHALVTIGVTSRGGTAAAALDENSAAAAKIGETARTFGIVTADIRTGTISLQPAFRNVRDQSGQFEQKPDGYQVTNAVTIRIRDLARVGEFLRRFVDGGANRINGISFGIADRNAAERRAGAAAVADARSAAAALAEAAGVKLGRVEAIRALSGGAPSGRPMRMEALRAAPDVPVEPGSLEITAEVEVAFSIERP